ncbi:hypothetical protein BKA80DRAFT_93950 [Phyllosticta citrichinensis]
MSCPVFRAIRSVQMVPKMAEIKFRKKSIQRRALERSPGSVDTENVAVNERGPRIDNAPALMAQLIEDKGEKRLEVKLCNAQLTTNATRPTLTDVTRDQRLISSSAGAHMGPRRFYMTRKHWERSVCRPLVCPGCLSPSRRTPLLSGNGTQCERSCQVEANVVQWLTFRISKD